MQFNNKRNPNSMKAIRMRIQKFSRAGVILLATVVAIITSVVVANAAQTFATPNAAFVSYSLAGFTDSAAITPATNRSVLVMGCCTTAGVPGVGQVTLLHVPSSGFEWVGLESTAPPAITQGFSATAGTKIANIGATGLLIQVASADTIHIHNGQASTRAANVTLIW